MKTIQKVTFVIFFITLVYCAAAAPSKESLEENKQSQNGEKSNLITGLVGGKKVSISKYPYMASVITRTSLEGSAVILNKNWVLTTGWVVLYEEADQVLIRAGSDSAIDKGQTSYAEKIVIHPQYSHAWKNDIALIKLKNPLKFNKDVKAIKLTTKTPEKGAKADISGFGYASANRQYSTDTRKDNGKLNYLHDGWLRATTLKVITYKDCQSYYQGVPYFTDVSFCAQASSTVGPCTFDWGSPLVVKNQVIGIFSGVNVCADEKYPPVFTDVIKFKDWINKTIKKNSSPKELEDLHMDIEYIN